VLPAGFEPSSGVLALRPDSRAWATQTQLLGPQLLERIHQFLGSESVQKLRVLEPDPSAVPRRKSRSGENESLTTPAGVHRVWRPDPPAGAEDVAVEAARERQRRETPREVVNVAGGSRGTDAAGRVRARALRRARAGRSSRS